jgi:hypothetical protein
MPCSEKQRLLEAYKATVEMYTFAVRRLEAERTNGNRAGYQDCARLPAAVRSLQRGTEGAYRGTQVLATYVIERKYRFGVVPWDETNS